MERAYQIEINGQNHYSCWWVTVDGHRYNFPTERHARAFADMMGGDIEHVTYPMAPGPVFEVSDYEEDTRARRMAKIHRMRIGS